MKDGILNKSGILDYNGFRDFYEKFSDKVNFFLVRKYNASIYPAHFHSTMELYYVCNGIIKVFVNGVKYMLSPGDILYLNSFDIHSFEPDEITEVVVLQFGESFLDDLKELTSNINFNNKFEASDVTRKIGTYLDQIVKDIETGDFNYLDKKVCVDTILNLLYKTYGCSQLVKKDKIQDVIKYIYQNYKDPGLGLKQIAKEFGYSEVSMSRIFHQYVNVNIRNFINMVRFINVQRLLEEKKKKNIVEIVYECGFDSISTYYRYKKSFIK